MSNCPCQNRAMIKNKNKKPALAEPPAKVIDVNVVLKPKPAAKPAPDASASDAPIPALLPKRPRVALEPELEEIAAFWPAAKRFEMARKFGRWARQLKVSGFILFHDSHPPSPPSLRFVGFRKARLN
jgi:hypothetical protein